MAPGLPDRVDSAYLADNATVLERVYPLREMPRLQDLLADTHGSIRAKFAFVRVGRVGAERAGALVEVETTLQLLCQRCLQGFAFAAAGLSEIEFSSDAGWGAAESQREIYVTETGGLVSLREMAEEELLLALPIVAACSEGSCARAPAADARASASAENPSRPFAVLQDLLKKT